MLLQLSGVPGSGKSTLARGIAEASGFLVVDTDVLKSALIEGGVPVAAAGRPTYAAGLALAPDFLAQGGPADANLAQALSYPALPDRRVTDPGR